MSNATAAARLTPAPMPPGPVTGPSAWFGPRRARSVGWARRPSAEKIAGIGATVPPVFAPRYGSVTPGDRGGIMVPGTRLSVSLTPA